MLAEFLRERGIVPEKNDLNTILFLVTPGIEISKAGTLITALVDFKAFFDSNALLWAVLPEFVAARPQEPWVDTAPFRGRCGGTAMQPLGWAGASV
jgi:ornithine decarboxylase